jgi:hypothetical protein
MWQNLKLKALRAYRAFSSPANTLVAQTLIATLLFAIGALAASNAYGNSSHETEPSPRIETWDF